jgi:hypothetical protein
LPGSKLDINMLINRNRQTNEKDLKVVMMDLVIFFLTSVVPVKITYEKWRFKAIAMITGITLNVPTNYRKVSYKREGTL